MTRNEALNEIALQVQQWLDWQERERKEENLACTDDTHMMRVPVWPTRGQLNEWVKILKTPNVEFSGAPQLHRGASAGTQGSASDVPEKGSPNE